MPSWKGKTRGGVLGYRFFIFLIAKFGTGPAYAFLRMVVAYFVLFAPKASKAIFFYFRAVHGYSFFKSIRFVFKNFYIFGQVIVDRIAILSGFEKKFKFEFDNYDELLARLDAKKGCVLIGAHIGNWEVAGQFFGDYGSKINIVMLDAEYERIKNMLNNIMGDKNYQIIPYKNDFSHIFAIKNALSNQEYVCFQGDRYVDRNNVFVGELLGRETVFPNGPFIIAAKFNVPVVFFYAMKVSKYTYRFYFFPANIDEVYHKLSTRDKAHRLLNEYLQSLNTMLTRFPEQWFNYYPFWEKVTEADRIGSKLSTNTQSSQYENR